jgi:cation diffusion facilitator CzcD-associated flavoprotein CzcO
MSEAGSTPSNANEVDVIVVGAGIGGLYAVHRFRSQGLTVQGLEGAPDVGGVWYHNGYPGARVDIESYDYCYYFSPELYREWTWTEKYATQPEILSYLNHVADRFDVRRHFAFKTWLTGAQWVPSRSRYDITTSTGERWSARYLVMASGQLSRPRPPDFPGLERFRGDWAQSSQWTHDIELKGRRVAVIGTGSSGVQTVPVAAEVAEHVYVFQRSPNFIVPAWNGPMNETMWQKIKEDVEGEREVLFNSPGGRHQEGPVEKAVDMTPAQREERMEAVWQIGGHSMNRVFADQGVDPTANGYVADFVRGKIRETVHDPDTAERLSPRDHPIGARRLVVDSGYWESFNRDNVSLVDVRQSPIETVTERGILCEDGTHYEVDVIIFALGFQAFTGQLDGANIRNEHGQAPTDGWRSGPRTYLGLMTTGFPNLFLPTGPGSPSVLANFTVQNEFLMEYIADLIEHVSSNGGTRIEPTVEAEDEWTAHAADAASGLLRLRAKNYMVHVNEDGSRVMYPYVGGLNQYVQRSREIADNGYTGFTVS